MKARSRLFTDSVSVQTYQGEGAYGPVLSDPVSVLGKVSYQRQLVRDPFGAEVVSEMTIYTHSSSVSLFPPGSQVTFDGRVALVLGSSILRRPGESVVGKVTCS